MSYNEVSGLAGNRIYIGYCLVSFYNRLLFTIGYCQDDPTSKTQPSDSTNIMQKLSENDATNSVVPNQFESLSFQICFLHYLAPPALFLVCFSFNHFLSLVFRMSGIIPRCDLRMLVCPECSQFSGPGEDKQFAAVSGLGLFAAV